MNFCPPRYASRPRPRDVGRWRCDNEGVRSRSGAYRIVRRLEWRHSFPAPSHIKNGCLPTGTVREMLLLEPISPPDSHHARRSGFRLPEDVGAMPGEVRAVLVAQAVEARRRGETERGARDGAERWGGDREAVVVEGDEAFVEGGVPESGEEEAVMDVEALRIARAVRPADDVRGAQQRPLGDAGERAAALPIVEQRVAEDVLPDTLHDEPLRLGRARQPCGFRFEPGERRRRQADAEPVNAIERGIERRQRRKSPRPDAG